MYFPLTTLHLYSAAHPTATESPIRTAEAPCPVSRTHQMIVLVICGS